MYFAKKPFYESETFWIVVLTAGGPLLGIAIAIVLPALVRWLGVGDAR